MKLRNSLLLLLTATIWGVAFVAQSVGMDYVGPFTFVFARNVIGGLVLLPVIAVLGKSGGPHPKQAPEERRKACKTLIIGGMCCGTALCAGSITQQFALLYTPVGKAGFLTACYILIVPLLGLLFGRKCGLKHWCGVALAMAGLYFLCMTGGSFGFAMGDLIGLSCALLFSIHITVIDHFSPMVDGVKMSCIQFFFCAILSGIGMLIFEQPSFANILAAWKPILYAGAMSSGVGYTLQIVGQKGMNPAVASLIMSLESVISVIAGWLILGQALSGREIFGCVLMFGAIVLAQLPERKRKEATDAYSVYEEIIKDNIEYDYLIQDRYLDRDRIEEILALILETVCTKRKTIRIAGDDYPAELVKARFMKLNSEHIRFVLDCMQENTTKIRNIKQYMKAALFNAPSTIGSYYTSLVSHDMADGTFYGKPKKSGIPDYTCNEGESL